MKKATIVFVPFWRVIAAGSMRVGVTRAGYSLWEESTILMLTFLLPAIVARLISWRFL